MENIIRKLTPLIQIIVLLATSVAVILYLLVYLPKKEKTRIEKANQLSAYRECKKQEEEYNRNREQYAKEKADRVDVYFNTPFRPGVTKEQATEGFMALAELEKKIGKPYRDPFDFDSCVKQELRKIEGKTMMKITLPPLNKK